jgi:protein Mpv17
MSSAMIRGSVGLRRPRKLISSLRQERRKLASIPKPPNSVGAEGSQTFFKRLLEKYNATLMKHPLKVKASAASIIFFVSDSATQKITDPEKDWDVARSGSGAGFGVVATAWLHYWWGFLEIVVNRRLPVAQFRLSNTLTKVVLDQTISAPFYIYTYFVITNFLQDWNKLPQKSSQQSSELLYKTCDKAQEMLPPTMMRHWALWPAVHCFNFYYMPLHHRVLVQNIVLIGWSGCKC